MRVGRPWGGAGAAWWNYPANGGRCSVMHDFYENRFAVSGEGLPMHFEAGGDALVASGLAEIGHRGGHLEWTEELLLSA
jgi:hypothetical protein